jgi:hypothetical protein
METQNISQQFRISDTKTPKKGILKSKTPNSGKQN